VIKSIRHNLANLANFRGRETRSLFWPYFGVVAFLSFVALWFAMLPEIEGSMDRMQRFAAEHPELATVERSSTSYSITIEGHHPELMPDFGRIGVVLSGVVALAVLLLAAAVVRRLHDCGKSGAWAIAPVLFLGLGLSLMPILFSQNPPNLTLFLALFLNNILYLASLVYVVVLLAGTSMKDDNRFAPQPT
jgi:uncharacterized membrane protein YhaH (DUF805 family)